MSIGDLFRGKENAQLKERVAQLEALLSPEMRDSLSLQQTISHQRSELSKLQQQISDAQEQFNADATKANQTLESLKQQISQAKLALVETEEAVLMQSFGLYKPQFSFANSSEYKEELDHIRAQQKECIKAGNAATGNSNWTVNGDKRKGAKMIHDMQKLLIRAFNCECDDVVSHVKFNNVEASEKRIHTAFDAISKLGAVCGVAISHNYLKLKIKELHLAHEYQIAKQKEKEALKQLKAEERERIKLAKEIIEARKKIEKEQKHYSNALIRVEQQISTATPEELPALERKKAELEEQLGCLDASMQQIDYREANQKAGYVYIISNIGAFGEGVYKIGMTRRLEPMERIDELGDASVPFNFDVHALIFSDNAPALEAALHKAFESRKLNMVNPRREFFRVSLDEIKTVIRENFDQTVDFVDVPPAEQFRQSKLMVQQ